VSKVPPKIYRSSSRKPYPKTRGAKSKVRIQSTDADDGFIDEDKLSDDDGSEQVEREERIGRYLDREFESPDTEEARKPKESAKEQAPEEVAGKETQDPGKAFAKPRGGQKPAAAASQKPITDGLNQLEQLKEHAAKLEKTASINPGSSVPKGSPMSAITFLHNAKPPGSFFTEVNDDDDATDPRGEGGQQQDDTGEGSDPEALRQAVEDLLEQLKDVPGIARVRAGRDEEDRPIVLVVAERGFTQGSLRMVPEKIQQFQTVLAVPYDILPLKRERPAV
jgi:hypothetical protein